ncbi:MAG TPA: hypothetical protein VEV83_09405 [Parafilimonas sp.]|nr:hypothetical protein [Parafilimonas sp.]
MHQASVKDNEEKWLLEVLPTIHELIFYLTRLNDSIMVYVKKIYKDPDEGSNVYEMSNGLSYTHDGQGRWRIV